MRRQDDDADQRRGNGRRQARQQVDDGEAGRDHRIGVPAHPEHLRHLGREDQDRQRVDEAGADRARDEAHQHVEPQQAEDDLERTGQQGGGQQIVQAVRPDQRGGDQRDGPRGAGDHRRAAAGEGDDDADDEGGEQPDLRVDARHEGEGDDLGDQGEGADHAGEHLAPEIAEAGEPFGAVARQGSACSSGCPQ